MHAVEGSPTLGTTAATLESNDHSQDPFFAFSVAAAAEVTTDPSPLPLLVDTHYSLTHPQKTQHQHQQQQQQQQQQSISTSAPTSSALFPATPSTPQSYSAATPFIHEMPSSAVNSSKSDNNISTSSMATAATVMTPSRSPPNHQTGTSMMVPAKRGYKSHVPSACKF